MLISRILQNPYNSLETRMLQAFPRQQANSCPFLAIPYSYLSLPTSSGRGLELKRGFSLIFLVFRGSPPIYI